MIFDFNEKFPEIYPINMDLLLNPDREKFGYFWDFEDYMIKENLGLGLNLQGILMVTENDLSLFAGLFDTAFKITTINSRIKLKYTNYSVIEDNFDYIEKYRIGIVDKVRNEFKEAVSNRNKLMEDLGKNIKSKKIWLSLNSSWTPIKESDNKIFWGPEVDVIRLPDFFSVMNMMDLWKEIDEIGPSVFDADDAWSDFAFENLDLIKYIDEDIAKRTGVWSISIIRDMGLI